ncbi:helix-turn-helix domain-containing protein [Kocuria sp. M1N1S27]|uniref:helix-turn-helix domain-containing protein n=1 Tax=Kocuria kalidii TaxID=3376283 RepID=UPI0037B2D18E
MRLDKMNVALEHPSVRARLAGDPLAERAARRAFGRKLQMHREYQGITRQDIARVLGMEPDLGAATVALIEAGDVAITAARADAIEEALGIPAPALMQMSRMAVTDAPLPHEPSTTPKRRRASVRRRVKALAVLSVIVAAVLAVAALLLFTAGHVLAGALALAAAWILFSPAAALVTAQMIARGHGRQGR